MSTSGSLTSVNPCALPTQSDKGYVPNHCFGQAVNIALCKKEVIKNIKKKKKEIKTKNRIKIN